MVHFGPADSASSLAQFNHCSPPLLPSLTPCHASLPSPTPTLDLSAPVSILCGHWCIWPLHHHKALYCAFATAWRTGVQAGCVLHQCTTLLGLGAQSMTEGSRALGWQRLAFLIRAQPILKSLSLKHLMIWVSEELQNVIDSNRNTFFLLHCIAGVIKVKLKLKCSCHATNLATMEVIPGQGFLVSPNSVSLTWLIVNHVRWLCSTASWVLL